MNILKVNNAKEPEIVVYSDPYGPGTNYHLLNLPQNEYFFMGSGDPEFINVSSEKISYSRKGIKSFFLNQGGPFWSDSIETYSFLTKKKTSKFVNYEGESAVCMNKEDFLIKSGWKDEGFGGLNKICIWRK